MKFDKLFCGEKFSTFALTFLIFSNQSSIMCVVAMQVRFFILRIFTIGINSISNKNKTK